MVMKRRCPFSVHRLTASTSLSYRNAELPALAALKSHRLETDRRCQPRAMGAGRGAWLAAFFALWLVLGLGAPLPARAEQPEFTEFEITRNDEGVILNFALRFE